MVNIKVPGSYKCMQMFILMRSPLHSPIDGTGLSKQLTQKKKHMLIHCDYRCPAFRQTHNIPHYWSPQNDAEPLLSLEKALGGVTCRSLEVASSTLATLPRSLQARSKAFRGGKAHDKPSPKWLGFEPSTHAGAIIIFYWVCHGLLHDVRGDRL